MKKIYTQTITRPLLALLMMLGLMGEAWGQTQFFWRNDGGLDGNWNASNRWWIGSPAAAGFGQLNFGNNAYLTATCNGSFDTWRIFISSAADQTRTTTGTGTVTFYDFSGQVPVVRNESSAVHVFNQNFSVGNTSGSTLFDRRLELIAVNGDLSFGGTFSSANVNNVARSLRLDASSSRTINMNGTITQVNASNPLLVQKIGSGTANLIGDNSFTLGVVMDAGVIRAGHNNAFGTGTFEFYGGVLASTDNTSRNLANNFLIGGNVTFGQATGGTGNLTVSGTINLNNSNRTVAVANSNTNFSGIISNGGLTKSGTGTLTLSAANTYTGSTNITAGTIQLSGSGTLGVNSDVRISSGASLNLDGVHTTVGSIAEAGTDNGGTINLGAATLTINGFTGSLFQNSISGTGSLVKNGSGTLALYGTQSYTGATTVSGGELSSSGAMASASYTISGGTFRIGATNIIPDAAVMNITGGTLAVDHNETVQDITLTSGTINVASGRVLTINGTLTITPGAIISGDGQIQYGPAGKLVITGGTNYTLFNGIFPATNGPTDFEVAVGGTVTLHANRTITGAVTLSSGVLAIGTNTLTLAGTISATSGSLTSGATGTVNYSGTHQTVLAATYGNLNLSGSGTKTFAGLTAVARNLSVAAGVVVNLGSITNHSTSVLILGTSVVAAGTWGGVGSTAANTNPTFFDAGATGQITVLSSTTLSVQFKALRATRGSNGIAVEWNTENEQELVDYSVERSADGRGFSSIGRVAARNNQQPELYRWDDAQPGSGDNFYRIKAQTRQGRSFYSSIVRVRAANSGKGISVYPNPVAKGQPLNVELRGMQKGTYRVTVFSPMGVQVLHRVLEHGGGDAAQTMLLPAELPAGTYVVDITDASGSRMQYKLTLQ